MAKSLLIHYLVYYLSTLRIIYGFSSVSFHPTRIITSNSRTSKNRIEATRLNYQSAGTSTADAVQSSISPRISHKSLDKVKENGLSALEFINPEEITKEQSFGKDESNSGYPFAAMLQGSARYIATHGGAVAVFHIPGELLEEKEAFEQLMDDISIVWLLGMKIVIVVGCRFDYGGCALYEYPHECTNSIRVTTKEQMRQVEEEAGFVKFEVERRLHKCLQRHRSVSPSSEDAPVQSGNVVGGNFYMAQPFGVVRGEDYKHTGYTSRVNVQNIKNALSNNDVVLLTTIAPSSLGEPVSVNGNHLAARVAVALGAHKLIYMANQGKVMRLRGDKTSLQDIPMSFALSVLKEHNVEVHRAGFAAFEQARQTLDPATVEMLLHMGWGAWALDQGVTRVHIVNPGDGAILEELFTSTIGANTCMYHDDEVDEDCSDTLCDEELDSFFAAATAQNMTASFA